MKAIRHGVDFIMSLIPYSISLLKIPTATINILGIFSALKNTTSCLADVYKYIQGKEKSKVLLAINLVSIIAYVVYIPLIAVTYFVNNDIALIINVSYVALGLAPAKDLFNCIKNIVLVAKTK